VAEIAASASDALESHHPSEGGNVVASENASSGSAASESGGASEIVSGGASEIANGGEKHRGDHHLRGNESGSP